jgi:hypothetical protein
VAEGGETGDFEASAWSAGQTTRLLTGIDKLTPEIDERAKQYVD